MFPAKRSSFRLRACVECGGDAYLDLIDEPEWRCLQCGRVAPSESVVQPHPEWPSHKLPGPRLRVFGRSSNGKDYCQ